MKEKEMYLKPLIDKNAQLLTGGIFCKYSANMSQYKWQRGLVGCIPP